VSHCNEIANGLVQALGIIPVVVSSEAIHHIICGCPLARRAKSSVTKNLCTRCPNFKQRNRATRRA
jgi:hypothetical protein